MTHPVHIIDGPCPECMRVELLAALIVERWGDPAHLEGERNDPHNREDSRG